MSVQDARELAQYQDREEGVTLMTRHLRIALSWILVCLHAVAFAAPEDDDSRLSRHERSTGSKTDPPADITLDSSEREEPESFRGLHWGLSPAEVAAIDATRQAVEAGRPDQGDLHPAFMELVGSEDLLVRTLDDPTRRQLGRELEQFEADLGSA